MRIIAGKRRGATLQAPQGELTRPTSDRARQTLFDMLAHGSWLDWPGISGGPMLDVFAGSGAIGLEAWSRGAPQVTFIEQDRHAATCIRANISKLKADDACRVITGSALRPPAGSPCSFVFLDPPYAQDLIAPCLTALLKAGWIDERALIVGEIGLDEQPPLPALSCRTVGAATFCFWRKAALNAP